MAETTPVTAAERLWLNGDRTRVVSEGDPDAAWLLAAEGQTVTADDAKQLGVTRDGRPAKR